MTLIARGRAGAETAVGALRSAVGQVDREQPLFRMQSVEALLFNRSAGQRATTEVLGLPAAAGAYGVMAYTAAQRVREIGIRLALGATQREVFRMALGGGFLPAAFGVTPLLRAVDPGVDAGDGLACTVVAVVFALGASAVPAWRVMRVDPASVLRNQ